MASDRAAESGPILVIDDDEELRRSLVDVLRDVGYDAVGAADGREAVRLLRDGLRPPVIFLDLMMPVMDGEEFLRLRQQDAEVLIQVVEHHRSKG